MGDVREFCGENANGNGVLSHFDPLPMGDDNFWVAAEETAQEVVNCIHPTLDTEEKRRDVIDYIQRLIRCTLGCEVFPYGSVPLKTYLPDGDIDLTALSSPCAEESLAHDVLAVILEEERSEDAEYDVRDTQFIDAEVKLVKCLVDNIVIDISFNQLGGLCTLCFLEQVDRLVGKNHLFKRSIILIKAWCYYESRILGAHHGLISTYALETLVLYIFHLFHASLNGPLAVLYRFLDYFSKFDWDKYCISLSGPVRIASLPDVVVELPEDLKNGLMMSEEFLRNCIEMFSVPSKGLETNTRTFPIKHLNIFDPLKENNNLGRSVHRGNYYRIQSAFRYGARKIGRLLSLPRHKVADEIKKFFANTLERHGPKHGIGMRDSSFFSGIDGSMTVSSASPADVFSEDDLLLKSAASDFDIDSVVLDDRCSIFENELDNVSLKGDSSWTVSETSFYSEDGTAISANCSGGNVNGLAASGSVTLSSANGTSDCSMSTGNTGSLPGQCFRALSDHTSLSAAENGDSEAGISCQGHQPGDTATEKFGSFSWIRHGENFLVTNNCYQLSLNNSRSKSSGDSTISTPMTSILESLSVDLREEDLRALVDDSEALNPFSDLSGDYDSHIRSLLYGQCCHGFASSAPMMMFSPPSSFQYNNRTDLWDTVHKSMPLRDNSFSEVNTNTMFVGPPTYPPCAFVHADTVNFESKPRARGTGTYFPKTNSSCRERPLHGRGRHKMPNSQFYKNTRCNGYVSALSETKSYGKESHEVHAPVPAQGHEKSFGFHRSHNSGENDMLPNGFSHSLQILGSDTHSNGFNHSRNVADDDMHAHEFQSSLHRTEIDGPRLNGFSQSDQILENGGDSDDISSFSCRIEFGSLGNLSENIISGSCYSWRTGSDDPPEMLNSKTTLGTEKRVAEQNFHLKNEDEFPALSPSEKFRKDGLTCTNTEKKQVVRC